MRINKGEKKMKNLADQMAKATNRFRRLPNGVYQNEDFSIIRNHSGNWDLYDSSEASSHGVTPRFIEEFRTLKEAKEAAGNRMADYYRPYWK